MNREEFLKLFLGALGSDKLIVDEVTPRSINGTIHFSDGDTAEFCWIASNTDVPSKQACDLLKEISTRQLIDIDQICISRQQLHAMLPDWSKSDIDLALEEILKVEVSWFEEGKQIDAFFIHE